MNTSKISFNSVQLKQATINMIFRFKREIRKLDQALEQNRSVTRTIDRAARASKHDPFMKARVERLQPQGEQIKAHLNNLQDCLQRNQELLSDWIIQYDAFPSTLHEKAQLLGISHQHLQRFFQDCTSQDETLFSLAFIGAENHFERNTPRPARDCPLMCAASLRVKKTLDDNPELRNGLFDKMQEQIGPIPAYREAVNEKGKRVMVRLPPRLKVVEKASGA